MVMLARPMIRTVNPQKLVRDIIVIGASAGGIEAVFQLISKLPRDLPATLGVVIHRGAVATANWATMFSRQSQLPVLEPKQRQRLKRGVVYVAPSDRHMRFETDHVSLDRSNKEHFTRPAVDPLFCSAASVYAARVVGVVLTGGGHDGMRGLVAITAAGGLSLVQQPSEAQSASMPEYALAHDHVHAALPLDVLANVLPRLAHGFEVDIETRSASIARTV
jgi:two-component system, chemotaxis family, protein-glutamate methylesterase/glutaminase